MHISFLLRHMRQRRITPAVVVAIVANRSGQLGAFPQLVFPFIGNKLLKLCRLVLASRSRVVLFCSAHTSIGH